MYVVNSPNRLRWEWEGNVMMKKNMEAQVSELT